MRTALVCLVIVFTAAFAQEKAPPSERGKLVRNVDSICDGMNGNLVLNCGFEFGNFSRWDLSGALDFVSVSSGAANSGSYGGSFGAIGSLTNLSQTLRFFPGESVHVEFWLANLVGGSGTEFYAYWCPSLEEDCMPLLKLVDPDQFDWTYYPFGPLPVTGDGAHILFQIRHDPDYFYLDDVDVENSGAGAAALSDHK